MFRKSIIILASSLHCTLYKLYLKAGIIRPFSMHYDYSDEHPVILFDGVCNLCSGAVQFVIKRDSKDRFRFASLQSTFGQEVLKKLDLNQQQFNSFILLENGKIFTRSTAALRVIRHFDGWWWVLYIFIIIPPFIRNFIYSMIAQNRYRWFGKKTECWVPSPKLKIKFIS